MERTIDDVLSGHERIMQVQATEEAVFWLASLPSQDGRVTIRELRDGKVRELTPEANVRARVMEYGGGAYSASDAAVAYCDDKSSQVMLLRDGTHSPLTPPSKRFRFGGLSLDETNEVCLAIREDHDAPGEPRTEIVTLSLSDSNESGGTVLVSGADFYAGCTSNGELLAWYEWQHPNMSWDQASVKVAPLAKPAEIRFEFSRPDVSAQHPIWLPDGRLAFASDESGYWNWQLTDFETTTGWETAHDCDIPTWVLNQPPASPAADGRFAAMEHIDGSGQLTVWDSRTGETAQPLENTAAIESLASNSAGLYAVVSWPDRPETLELITASGSSETLIGEPGVQDAVQPRPVWAQGPAGEVHSWFYETGTANPSLLVLTHGGPTSMHYPSYDPEIQFWTSRGFAVLDVNYSGSTGFGREYRNRLRGQWGALDVADVVASVGEVTQVGLADPNRVIIAGGSAGGYTTLQSLVTTDVFAAGMSSYGIGDLETLIHDTHKAESRYLDSLIGPWPEAKEIYFERSPIHHLDRLATPMLLLQGGEDRVVPPAQAEELASAVRAKGLPLALVMFPEEGHGFRALAARKSALSAKLSFAEQLTGLPLSSDIEQLAIEHLE